MKNKNIKTADNKDITRKEALKKMGTYAAFTALGTMVLLSPKAAQAGSLTPPPPPPIRNTPITPRPIR